MSPGELRRRVSPLRPRTCVGTDAVIKARGGPHGQGASEGLLSYGADECTVHTMEDDPRPARSQSRLPFLQTGNYCSVAFCSNRHEAVSRRVTQQVLRSVILRLRYAHERRCSAVETPTRGFPELGALLAAAGRGVPPPRAPRRGSRTWSRRVRGAVPQVQLQHGAAVLCGHSAATSTSFLKNNDKGI